MHPVYKLIGFGALFGQVQIDEHTRVIFTLQLFLGKIHHLICVIKSLLSFII